MANILQTTSLNAFSWIINILYIFNTNNHWYERVCCIWPLTLTYIFKVIWNGLGLENCVCSVASTVQDGFFPYLVQMINSMRGCVTCDDPWPWPISSRSFGLDLENHVRSVVSTVLDRFFLYVAQMITIIRGCVACYNFFKIWKFEFLANFDLEKNLQFSMNSFHI